MIEREFVKDKIKNFKIKELIESQVNKYAGIGDIAIEKTPLGARVTVYAVRPGLVIGSGGESVKQLTHDLKFKFKMDNPQLEIKEIANPSSWAAVVARKIASDFERFGPKRYKVAGYRALLDVMRAGARGAEIRITGVGIPGERARSWRFFAGYLKKSGDTAETAIDRAFEAANLRRGTIGIKVMIMPKGVVLPDDVIIRVEEVAPAKDEVKAVKEAGEIIKAEVKKDLLPANTTPLALEKSGTEQKKKEAEVVKAKKKEIQLAEKPVKEPVKKTVKKAGEETASLPVEKPAGKKAKGKK